MIVLIVEDEKNLGQSLNEYFEGLGHQSYWSSTGVGGLELFKEVSPRGRFDGPGPS